MDIHLNTDPETTNDILINLLTEVLANQHIILDRLAEFDSRLTNYSKDEMQEFYQKARDTARNVVKEHLYTFYGPDLSKDVGL